MKFGVISYVDVVGEVMGDVCELFMFAVLCILPEF